MMVSGYSVFEIGIFRFTFPWLMGLVFGILLPYVGFWDLNY